MRLIRLIRNLISLSFILVILFFVFREPILKVVARMTVSHVTGFGVDIDRLKIGIFRPVIDIKGVKVNNPADYSDRVMLDLPQLYVRYAPSEILKGNIDISELIVTLKEFTVIKNKDGTTNVGELKGIGGAKEEGLKKSVSRPKKTNLHIGLFRLKLGRVLYKDNSVQPPSTKVYNLNINKEFRDIGDIRTIIRLIVAESLMKANLGNLADVDVKKLVTDTTSAAIGTTTKVIKKTAVTLENLLPFNKK
ncbi:MAG: hypothetical protein AUJ74_02110 [Candidatus Omnitrophica bacterium CG1_02_44_16]|nr:MAG: hypothetical protein AUJ74_02110 [Candidatus Omnitrophica bacterium CG1_02_44_16]PIZ84288.1 MAG: hypothetical protein COX96_04760 [Candidatus Omnitrophica bacterium CG_4_10_14_0_2_um_filter_44_9]